jgi:hypothetical protein
MLPKTSTLGRSPYPQFAPIPHFPRLSALLPLPRTLRQPIIVLRFVHGVRLPLLRVVETGDVCGGSRRARTSIPGWAGVGTARGGPIARCFGHLLIALHWASRWHCNRSRWRRRSARWCRTSIRWEGRTCEADHFDRRRDARDTTWGTEMRYGLRRPDRALDLLSLFCRNSIVVSSDGTLIAVGRW